jgi:small-conductance mechanosensitive channel
MGSSWIPLERISRILQFETALLVLFFAFGSYIFYRLFLNRLSPERHANLRKLFRNLAMHSVVGASFFTLYWVSFNSPIDNQITGFLIPYSSFLSLIWGLIIIVKTSRIVTFEYLFLGNMRAGVPLLLVNILTLILTLILAGLVVTEVFQIRLTSLLATSAVLSIVLGLALQETLGNLFAGVALQFDKPYNIGDWVEIESGGAKWRGQVFEISWRSTLLIGFMDELITIPNRTMAQALVSNWSTLRKPFVRSQVLRFYYGTDVERVRALAIQVASRVEGVVAFPAPVAIITETKESYFEMKLVYFIVNYGDQYFIGDRVLTQLLKRFNEENIPLAGPRLHITPSPGQNT